MSVAAPPPRPRSRAPRRLGLPIVLASLVVALGLLALVWYDYVATRRELLGLLRQHAQALRETVAAAARSNEAAAALSASQLGGRLLEQARALAALDREGRLTTAALEEMTRRDPLLGVGVFSADGSREDSAGHGPGAGGRGPGGGGFGPGGGMGPGGGRGRGQGGPGRGMGGGAGVARQILDEGKDEVVTGLHGPRWGGAERVAAGVKRPRGGAIVVTVDASEVARLQKPASLESMLDEVTRASPEIAYTVFEYEGGRLAFGDTPGAEVGPPAGKAEHETGVKGRSVLELVSDIPMGSQSARLRLGMRLDTVRQLERRMGLRLLASVLAASVLVALAFGLAGLGRRYGALSERHARAKEALRRRDRLTAMGELASTVAHEVRNPLNAVGMTAQRLRREFLASVPSDSSERAELEELLGVMLAETQRIDRIVQQFLDYARPPRLAPEPTDLGGLIETLVERTRPLAEARGVALETDLPSSGEARVDAAQLRQALDNLVRNAIEATPEGGRVAIGARCERDGCVIEVSDTGCGIAPEHLPKLFDLYFTTKPEGTGIGLAISQQIVTAHGGTIEVDSTPGKGTTMTVRLPSQIAADHA